MALAHAPSSAQPLTYEQYLAEPETSERYDIVDGIKHLMPNPTRKHQGLLFRLARIMDDYAKSSGTGQVIISPCDILIGRSPLRTRQPDVLFMSRERVEANPPDSDPAPLDPAPELVFEILSPSDHRAALAEKLTDYCKVDVRECWIISPKEETMEVVSLSAAGYTTVATYDSSQTAESVTFPELMVRVADLFEE